MDIAWVLQQDAAIDKFWRYIDKDSSENGCWLWTGQKPARYGLLRFRKHGKRWYVLAHRLSYALANGLFDQSLHICHKCDNPPCVNPEHLFAGTNRDNQHDKFRKGRQASTAGELHAHSKLKNNDVLFIRYCHDLGVPIKVMALAYGVSRNTVERVVNRKGWKHI